MEVGLLRRILKRAKLWTPFAGEVVLFNETSTIARVLSPAEKDRLFKVAAANPRWFVAHAAAEIAAATSCRKVELRHVRWRDVDFENALFSVQTTKGRTSGRRVMPLNVAALAAFRRLRQRAETRGTAAPDHYVFPKRDAKTRRPIPTSPMVREAWQSAWRSLTRAAGLRGLRFHDLRHDFLTSLAEQGTPESVLRALAGHRDMQTLQQYLHIRLPSLRAAVEKLNPPEKSVPRKAVKSAGRAKADKERSA